MLLIKELLTVLDNNEEPFYKRIKIADSAFRSSELPLPHKEAFLLKWIIKNYDYNNKETWELLNTWMRSEQFKDLNRSDIDTEEIISIIRMVKERLLRMDKLDNFLMQLIFNSLLLLTENGMFQQYFRYNIAVYCEFISGILDKIQCPNYFEEFLKKDIFPRIILTEDKFHKHFLEIIVPTLTKCLTKFNNKNLFQEVSKLIQKAIAIDPLVIEPITDYIIIYTMMADNREQTEEYENVIISIFEVYAKMHRIESLVTRMVSILNCGFNWRTEVLQEVYEFNGERDQKIHIMEEDDFKIEEIFTENIVQYFSKCICNLASWQIHMLMRSFLNVAYNWAEIYLMLEYYSLDNAVGSKKPLDNDFTSCNITYIHSYLNIQQWCLISERITNFGELPCKELLQKLYIQKLRAMLLFEKNMNQDIVSNILRSITNNLENSWKDILHDKYVVNHLLHKMDSASIIFLAEKLVNNIDSFGNFHKQPHILNSSLLLTSINYVTITKINKLLLKRKRKINENIPNSSFSTKIYSLFKEDKFLSGETQKEVVKKAKEIYHVKCEDDREIIEWKINEEKND
ncbi:hypothetical protein NQ314_016520 [Rhamnusium bicolor]|uniref:Uncharacterized protein n=1 Tax=Rhamnusium bicolor TaxID=1586634 RepID=A0AAV8WVS1_9CUCU|nr:hypothetical protein NQ314_016520 [Rhamnusium bicolor]